MKIFLSILIFVILSGCTIGTHNDIEKLTIKPIAVFKEFDSTQYKGNMALTSDSSGDIYLLLTGEFDKSSMLHNVKFISKNQVCEFQFSGPVSISDPRLNAIKIATRFDFERCHPDYKGFNLISTKQDLTFSNTSSRSLGIATLIEWKTNTRNYDRLISTAVYFIDKRL